MAEDKDNDDLPAEVNLLINRLQHLISSNDSSQDEANRHIGLMEYICSVIIQRYRHQYSIANRPRVALRFRSCQKIEK